ncbi:MAG: hypothetical protein K2N16_09995 [Muribaculaceae bacterium]|nr:hypothetical protein [Muribaculaceae bacterium]
MKKVLYILALAIAAFASHSCDNEFAYPPVIMGDIMGDGTAEAPFNITAAVRQCAKNGETSDQFYFVAGYVVSGSIDPAYGNATWDLYDNLNGDGQKFIAYRVKSFDGQKFTDAAAVKEGDYVVIYAPLINYKGNTPETGTGGYLYSGNGVVGGTSTPARCGCSSRPRGWTGWWPSPTPSWPRVCPTGTTTWGSTKWWWRTGMPSWPPPACGRGAP